MTRTKTATADASRAPRPKVASLLALAGVILAVVLPALPVALPTVGMPGFAAQSAAADDLNQFTFESFDAEYRLDRAPDGHAMLEVRETIVAVFSDDDVNRGFYRDIPDWYGDVPLGTEVISVVDENGAPVPFTAEPYENFMSIALGDDSFVHGRKTYVIDYRQRDTIRGFADTGAQEFYWDVNGTGWSQSFPQVSARLIVAPALVDALTGEAACYRGVGESTPCTGGIVRTDEVDGGAAVFTSSDVGLGPYETLTFAVGFAPGTFVEGTPIPYTAPDASTDGSDDGADTFGWLIFGTFGAVFFSAIGRFAVRLFGRPKPKPGPIVIPEYSAPKGLGVMPAAFLLGRGDRAWAAQLLDFAVRGIVRIGGDAENPDEVDLVTLDGLDANEQTFVKAVFGDQAQPGTRVDISRYADSIAPRLGPLAKRLEKDLVTRGLLKDKRTPPGAWVVIGIAFAIAAIPAVLFVMGLIGGGRFGLGGLDTVFFGIPAIIAVFAAFSVFAARPKFPAPTPAGTQAVTALTGLRDYLKLAETDRIRLLQSPTTAERVDTTDGRAVLDLYEKLLPYAVIWGVEKEWREVLELYAFEHVPAAVAGVGAGVWARGTSWGAIDGMRSVGTRQVALANAAANSNSRWGGSSGGTGGWSSSGGSSFSGGSSGGGFSGGGGGGGGGRGR
ncbi:DUF2207 domain-containing protein [Agromyces protaetiae]|uniref:DUF2207 domain-containing protein n=1 Tax=Agromyces protaetiae TaxID=2509455 RepID=A0A4P6FBH3_9MICO|nr:DUF2207 domain-containing protein [Agromyces protaetiae]QAY73105.1 DUF2207 domain-containing protein [Agromyces protaetiae]